MRFPMNWCWMWKWMLAAVFSTTGAWQLAPCWAAEDASSSTSAEEISRETGVRGGLIIHVGSGSGEVTATLRAGDILCRVGGDEFLALCPDVDANAAREIAHDLKRAA